MTDGSTALNRRSGESLALLREEYLLWAAFVLPHLTPCIVSLLRGVLRQDGRLVIKTLTQLGVSGIFTAYQNCQEVLASGAEMLQKGTFLRHDGTVGRAYDLGFSLRV